MQRGLVLLLTGELLTTSSALTVQTALGWEGYVRSGDPLVLGLIGLAVLPIVFSVPAIVMAVRARREIARNPGLHGREAAGWGLATGIMGTVLGIALIFMVVLGIVSPGA